MRSPLTSSSSSTAPPPQQESTTTTTTTTTSAPNPSKTTPCCSKVGLKRGPWTPEEDELLSDYIKREGEGRWRTLPKRAGLLRCGKSCRLRWMNYLRPSVKRGQIAPDEEDLILRLHRLLGNRWSLIAGRIPGRTDNEIKNYWNTHLSKKLISQGIDPRSHKPLDNTTTTITNPTAATAYNPTPAATDNSNINIISNISSPMRCNNTPTAPPGPALSAPNKMQQVVVSDESNNVSSTTTGIGVEEGDTTTPQTTKPPPTPLPVIHPAGLLNKAAALAHSNDRSYFDSYYNNHMINANNTNPILSINNNNNHHHHLSALLDPHTQHLQQRCASDDEELVDARQHQQQQIDQDHELNYCTDEVFSSFLNSLINEDVFAVPTPPTTITTTADHGACLTTTSCSTTQPQQPGGASNCFGTFGAAGWDAPPLMSTPPSTVVASSFHGGGGGGDDSCTQDHHQLR